MIRSNLFVTIYKSTLKILGLFLLIVIPKCSLCWFAVSTTIAICGAVPETASFWEYLLIGGIASTTAVFLYFKMKGKFKLLLRIVLLSGLGLIGSFLIFGLGTVFYFVGVGLISIISFYAFFFEVVKSKCCEVDFSTSIRMDNAIEDSIS